MKKDIIDIKAEEQCEIYGFIETIREQKTMAFIVVKDRSGSVQVAIEKGKCKEFDESIASFTKGSFVRIKGKAVSAEQVRPHKIEIVPSEIIIESIAQSIFNSRITRQTLPGFHAAQITPVGFTAKNGEIRKDSALRYHPDDAYQNKDTKKWISKNQYDRLSKEEQKNYKKGIAPYVEVMLPANNFGLTWDGSEEQQKELIAQLEDEGLDQMIGYRIRTDG